MKTSKNSLVRLEEIEKEFNLNNFVFAKVENTNPSGSIKDKAVYQMLIDYKNEGKLKEGTTIIEATSGNTGISLGYYKSEFKYNLVIVMPKSMSKERRDKISSYGAKLCLIDGGMEESERYALELVKITPNSILFDQFNNQSNPKAHYLTTGPEIYFSLPDTSYVFAGIGTGGTISGTGKFLKEKSPLFKIIGVEPLQSPLLTKGKSGSHPIQGIGANFIPKTFHKEYVDEIIDVDGEESIKIAKEIRKLENIDCGISSGAALLGAIKYIKENNIKDKKIVVIFPDKGDRYSW